MRLFNGRNLILFFVLAGLVAALYLWRRLGSSAPVVNVVRLQTGRLVQTFRTNGVVEPVEFREVRAEFASRVLQVRVEEGERVRAGQSLAQLDDRDVRVAVAQARAQLYEAEQSLARLRSAGTLEQLDAQIAQARADADLAASNLRRDELLVKQKAISQLEYEETAAANKKAEGRLEALEKERRAQASHLQPLAEDEAKARRDQAQAALQSAEARLRAAQVPAPMAGTVLAKPPRAGTLVSPGDLLAKVGDIEHLQVRAFVDQPDYSSLRVGSPVKITSNGFPGESWQGKVKSLSAELTTIGKRVVGEALCSIDQGPSRLPVNSSVDLTFTSREVSEAQLAPIDAVSQTGGRSYIYVVSNGRLRRREVQVGPSNTQFIVIKEGLGPDDLIFDDLEVRPQEGMSVEPRLVSGESAP